ncbi:uncharacterized protein LOC135378162 [Ornithodoros turicata]|uniref:uncharacterized protein LOC135378162 n=1 Tax=Ornithodoros turicata TaxID=34597 RepID=UPI003138C2BE
MARPFSTAWLLVVTTALLLMLSKASASRGNVWVLSQKEMQGDGCDFQVYEDKRNMCERKFSNVNVLTSGNNTCSDVQIYITCVKSAMRKTLCSANDTIKENEHARIMVNVRQKNVTCISLQAPQNMRQVMPCQKPVALKKFFACASTFHYYMKNKDDAHTDGPENDDCSVVSGYKDCVEYGLKHTECNDDKDFSDHILYFMKSDIAAYAKKCKITDTQELRLHAAISRGEKNCDQDKAIDTYLTCGKKFFDSVESDELRKLFRASEKIAVPARAINHFRPLDVSSTSKPEGDSVKIDPCSAVKSWLDCYYNDLVKANCTEDSELFRRSKTLYDLMVGEFNCVNAQFRALTQDQTSCQEKPMLINYFVCAINYNVDRKRIPENLTLKPNALCHTNLKFEKCVARAMRETRCLQERMSIMHHLKYLTDVITMPVVSCRENAAEYAKQVLARNRNCAKKTLFKHYFSCGLNFQKELEVNDNFNADATSDRRCKLLSDYHACYRKAVEQSECHSKSAITDTIQYLMEMETKDIDYKCEDQRPVYNSGIISPKCVKTVAVKNAFLCAMTFEHLVEDLKVKRAANAENICKHLEEMNTCVDIVKKSTGCDRDGEIFNHVTPILHSLTHDYDRACSNITSSFRMSFVQMKTPTTCVRQRVLKKMFVCGLSFSNLFDEMEPRVVGRNPVKCKLLIDYEQCIEKASRGTGCDEDAEMRVQIMSFSDIMRDEYKDSCPSLVYKNAPEQQEAFEDYEEDWADGDSYWYDSKEDSNQQGRKKKATRMNAPKVMPKEDPFGNIQSGMEGIASKQLVKQVENKTNASANEMDLSAFLNRSSNANFVQAVPAKKRRVHIEKEYLDDSAAGSLGISSDYREDGDELFSKSLGRRSGLRSRANERRRDPTLWINKRAMKMLDDGEQQEDDDIMGLVRHKKRRQDFMPRFSDSLNIKKQQDYEDEDYDILSDRETHISGDECNLKQLKKQSEVCDKSFSDTVKASLGKEWHGHQQAPPAKDVQDKLCTSLMSYRSCLLETAKRMRCSEIAGKVAMVVEEQMKKLGVAFCAGCGKSATAWFILMLTAFTTFVYSMHTI